LAKRAEERRDPRHKAFDAFAVVDLILEKTSSVRPLLAV
jgi:hypothetical protein